MSYILEVVHMSVGSDAVLRNKARTMYLEHTHCTAPGEMFADRQHTRQGFSELDAFFFPPRQQREEGERANERTDPILVNRNRVP